MPEIFQLPNGLRILWYPVADSEVVHCALMIKGGARDEPFGKTGIAHFIEHTFFKGTKRRSSKDLLNALETVGGELNAYTTKEETCLHASVLKPHFLKAADVISDIYLHATFPAAEIEKEKKVIIDEIHSYEDMPYEQIYDDFEGVIYKNHPLGNPILGKENDIASFSRKDIIDFIRHTYNMNNVLWIVAGNVSERDVYKSASLFNQARFKGNISRTRPGKIKVKEHIVKKPVSQYHYITGRTTYSYSHADRTALSLVNNVLGGPGMNSVLNMNIREKYGYTYTIESGYHAFCDTGLFHIYFATDKKYFDKTVKLVHRQLWKMAETPISDYRLNRFKKQYCGQITIAQENKLNLMLSMGRRLLNTGEIATLKERIESIKSITTSQYNKVAESVLNPEKLSTLIWVPDSDAS